MRLAASALVAVVCLFLGAMTAHGQVFGVRSKATADAEPENVFIRPDRAILQQLAQAQQLLDDKEYGDAVKLLDKILEHDEDYFFQPDKKSPLHRSLKAEAQRLIGLMPEQGLATYHLRFGAEAKRLLDESVLSSDVDGLAYVSRRFFHTDAGYQATFLLGLDHLNHARPLAAALTLQRLLETGRDVQRFEPMASLAGATAWLQSGMPEKSQTLLVAMKGRLSEPDISIAGKPTTLFDENAKAVDWLSGVVGPVQAAAQQEADRWLMLHGNATRTARSDGGVPLLNMLWHVPTSDDPLLEEMLRQVRQFYVEQDQPNLPGLHPLVVNDLVLMRSARNLLAIDFETGKRVWEVPVDDPWESLLGKNSPETLVRNQPQWALGMGQRVRDDATYGTLSSDGALVFIIEDLGMGAAVPSNRPVIVGGRNVQNAPATVSNRLAAHEIATQGKLKWNLGGPADQFALRQAETFFLGPPLPLMGQLFVLAESKQEGAVVLMALDAQTGDLLWQQPLAMVESTLLEDPGRRMSGVSPSYSDGLLICPTSVGAVVAVDMATRSLLWGYRFRRDVDQNQQMMMMRLQGVYQPGQPVPLRWTDGSAMIADGKVLITPIESDEIHCLNLLDGKPLWTQKRQDDLYLACIYKDRAILVGRRAVRAIRLSDGKSEGDADRQGRIAEFAEGVTPSGRGFVSENKYYLPLTSAEVVAIDLDKGGIVERAKSRKGVVPGNLVCYRGRIVSQGYEGVETFYQRATAEKEVQQRLAVNADDAVALTLRGEILLDEGKPHEAIDCFRRAFAQDGDPRTKDLLRDSLLEGLRTQFVDYRSRVDEIESLLDGPDQRAAFLRVMAEGLQAAGQFEAAFEQYVKLMNLDDASRRLESVSSSHAVRRDRWVQARLLGLLSEASDPAVRTAVERAIEARLAEAVESGQVVPLQRFVDYFGSHPMALTARRQLARRLAEADRILEAEMVLWRDQQSSDPAVAAPAVAQIAEMLRKIGRNGDAATQYARLIGEFADVVCLDGKTGRQLFDALAADSPVRQTAVAGPAWPSGLVEVEKSAVTGPRQPMYGRFGLRYDGSPAPFFNDVAVQYDQNQRSVLARDGLGNEMWRVALTESQNHNIFFNRAMAEGAVHGHLLLMSLGWKILAIDTAGNSVQQGGKLLWDYDLTSAGFDLSGSRNLPPQIFGGMPWGFQQYHYTRMNNRMNGVGPATSRIICFQRFRTLVAIDPISGEALWTQGNVPPNSELFGDDEYVFVLPHDETEALVYRALDGAPLGKKKIPRSTPGSNEYYHDGRGARKYVPITVSCMASFGRHMVLWRREGSQRSLELYDPWEERTLWGPMTFHERSQVDVTDNLAVAVCEPEGKFTLVTLPDGKKLVDTQLEVDGGFDALQNISLMRYEDRYLLLTHNPRARQAGGRNIQPLPGVMMQPITRGWAFAFDTNGKSAWPKPVLIESRHLAPSQPSRSPVLVLASQEYLQSGNTARNHTLVTCIDKRSGRIVCDEKFDGSTGSFEMIAAPETSTVELRFQQHTIVLKLTDKPIPPEPEPVKAPPEKVTPIKAIFKALQRTGAEFKAPVDEDRPVAPPAAESDTVPLNED